MSIINQVMGGAICMALDGDWGAGKTFFIREWARDLAGQQYPVVQFDAWKNDLTDDALVGFMADLSAQLKEWTVKLPPAKRRKAQEKIKDFVKQAGKAVVPAAQEVAKGLLKKAIGTSVDSIIERMGESDTSGAEGNSDGWLGNTEAALEKFFENSLDAHAQRQKALESLRGTLALLAEHLEKYAGAKLPIYIFVDELDRCRPDYAIRLLEGVKHLFDASGVCFVFSTNVSQLAHSVRAIYGEGFDSKFYLKRFFTFEYALPAPDQTAFAESMMQKSFFGKLYGVSSGLPADSSGNVDSKVAGVGGNDAAISFALVSTAFKLDLRSQLQVLRHAEAAIAEIKPGSIIHTLFLFFLVAVFHRNRDTFMSLESIGLTQDNIPKVGYFGASIKVSERNYDTHTHETREVTILEVFHTYQKISRSTIRQLLDKSGRTSGPARYPGTITEAFVRPYYAKPVEGAELTAVANYHTLVKYAGQLQQ